MEKIKIPIRKYWNWRSRTYGYDRDKSVTIADTWESVLKELVAGVSGKRALDIGTGTGQFAAYLARLGFSVTGIDISEKMISHARQYANEHHLDINFHTGDAENLGFEDNTFDIAVSRNLLWTLPHPDKAMKEWHRIMKPGGTLVISDGLWMNYTWKRVHHLIFRIVKGISRNTSIIPFRFFCTYMKLQKSLPFYEGIHFEQANRLLQAARFKDIRSYDTSCFEVSPYGGKNPLKNSPLFFIVYAKR